VPGLGLHVEQLPGDVLLRDQEVVAALARAQARVELARLGVDEIGGELARVAAEERVRERAVAPEEAREVQAREELGERVEQAVAEVGDATAGEQDPVGEREV